MVSKPKDSQQLDTQEAEEVVEETIAEATVTVEGLQAQLLQAQERETTLSREADKLQHAFNSLRGNVDQKLDLTAELARIRRSQATQENLIQLIAARTASGDTEQLADDLQRVANERQQVEQRDAQQEAAQAIWEDLLEEARDISPSANPEVTLRTAPELEGVRNAWNQGFQPDRGIVNTSLMRRAVKQAKDVRREGQLRAVETQKKEEQEEVAAKKRGNLTMSPTRSAASAGISGRTHEQLMDAAIMEKDPAERKKLLAEASNIPER